MDTEKSVLTENLISNQNKLHEIELEDIQLDPKVQKNIYKTVAQMFSIENPTEEDLDQILLPIGEITCKGYWVESTRELILYVWIGDQSKTIIVPRDGWDIRDDITIH